MSQPPSAPAAQPVPTASITTNPTPGQAPAARGVGLRNAYCRGDAQGHALAGRDPALGARLGVQGILQYQHGCGRIDAAALTASGHDGLAQPAGRVDSRVPIVHDSDVDHGVGGEAAPGQGPAAGSLRARAQRFLASRSS